jgi:hypothetical protein
MLARSTKLKHPLGISFETPLLIPSFSSKGFGVSKSGESEIRQIFAVASEYLTDTMLVSAYDLSYNYLDPIVSAITELTFIDSGGYEISDYHDLSAVYRYPVAHEDWTQEKLREVLDAWPEHVPAVFVSFDRPDIRQPLPEQIEAGRSLFSHYRNQMNTLLIKPETTDQQYVQVKNVVAYADELGGFDIIGFTEKELGGSILKRMTNIAAIRLAMDDAGLQSVPIHIYGSLDPLTSLLYFLAGSELFDGLTWIRYAYSEGVACYQHNYGVREIGIDRNDDFVKAKTIQDNLSYLLELTRQMRKFLLDSEGDFSKFEHNSMVLRESYDLLRTKNKRI